MLDSSNVFNNTLVCNRQDDQTIRLKGQPASTLRLLVVIASYGLRNLELLKKIIKTYQEMPFDVDIVVVSEAEKDLGLEVEVKVGLPSKNPWSLPFAHKEVMASRVESYDLFAYSEDDMLVTEANIRAFMRITPQLNSDEIAGFLRYEVDGEGNRSLPDVHAGAHWRPSTAEKRGDTVIAEFSNEHAAFYLLTQEQLKRAIASGGFLREPCEGRYDMLCTAATDPYTNCGMRKVVCVTFLDAFLIHHTTNQYAGILGEPLSLFKVQIAALEGITNRQHPNTTLFDLPDHGMHKTWYKSYYENPSEKLIDLIPKEATSVLSIGCGAGILELKLANQGMAVSVLPLDSVIGSVAQHHGIKVFYENLIDGLNKLDGKQFDVILLSDLLHFVPEPAQLLKACESLCAPAGVLLMRGTNFEYLPIAIKRLMGRGGFRKLKSFSQSGFRAVSLAQLSRWCESAGLNCDRLLWEEPKRSESLSGSVAEPTGLRRFRYLSWYKIRTSGLALDTRLREGRKRPLQRWLGLVPQPGNFLCSGWTVRAIKSSAEET